MRDIFRQSLRMTDGESRMTGGESRMTGGESRMRVGESRMRVGESRMRVGESRMRVGESRMTVGESRMTVGESRMTPFNAFFLVTHSIAPRRILRRCAYRGDTADFSQRKDSLMVQRTKTVPPDTLAADHETVKALQSMVDYQPTNADYSVPHLLQVQATLTQAELAEKAAEVALQQARIVRAETSHFYHDLVVNSRTQVIAQFGPDSAAVALVGLTRKSQRKRPVKRQTPPKRGDSL